MAEDYEVSRNAIFKQLHNVVEKLMEYESKLHLVEKANKRLEIIEKLEEKYSDNLIEELKNID